MFTHRHKILKKAQAMYARATDLYLLEEQKRTQCQAIELLLSQVDWITTLNKATYVTNAPLIYKSKIINDLLSIPTLKISIKQVSTTFIPGYTNAWTLEIGLLNNQCVKDEVTIKLAFGLLEGQKGANLISLQLIANTLNTHGVVVFKLPKNEHKLLTLDKFVKVLLRSSLPLKSKVSHHHVKPHDIFSLSPLAYISRYHLNELLDCLIKYDFNELRQSEKDQITDNLISSKVVLGEKLNILPFEMFPCFHEQLHNFKLLKSRLERFAEALKLNVEYTSLISSCIRTYEKKPLIQKTKPFDQNVMLHFDTEHINKINWQCVESTFTSAFIDKYKLNQQWQKSNTTSSINLSLSPIEI